MQFTRIGKERLFKTVSLNKIPGKVIANEENQINELGIKIDRGKLPQITADLDELSLLFKQLMSNALKLHHSQ